MFRFAWRNRHSALLCGIVVAGMAMASQWVTAQERVEEAEAPAASAPDAASPASSTKKQPETILELIVAGGPMNIGFMIFLGMFSLVAAAVDLERLVNLRRGKVLPPAFVRELDELVRRGEHRAEAFQQLCQRSTAPIATILKAGLLRVGRPLSEVEKSMEDAAAREAAALRSRARPLSVIANVAPLIGLLGTVVGMLEAFRVASQAGLGKAEILAEGIYLALETTVAGLIIAIPSLLFAAWFNGRSEKYLREIDERLMDVVPCLARLETKHVAAPSPHAPALTKTGPAIRSATSNPLMTSHA